MFAKINTIFSDRNVMQFEMYGIIMTLQFCKLCCKKCVKDVVIQKEG